MQSGLKLAGFLTASKVTGYRIATKLTISRFDYTVTSAQRIHLIGETRTNSMRLISLPFSSEKLAVPFNRLTRLLATFSVRTRVIVLALVPVVGFLANGLTYVSGEGDVGTAFETVKRSATLSDASRDFKSAIADIRLVVKDFTAAPSPDLVVSFAQAHSLALKSLDTIEYATGPKAASVVGLRQEVMDLRDNFNELVRQQNILGFDEKSGLRGNLESCRQCGRAHHQ